MVFLILLFFVLPVNSQDITFPEKQDTVTDYTYEVDPETREKVRELAGELRRVTSINLAVAVIHSTRPLDLDTYAKELYDKWDVGRREKGLDHGVLLLVAILDRGVKIIVSEGVDHVLTPKIREDMQWGLFPLLGEGEISEAVHVGAAAITQFLLTEWPKLERPERKIDIRTISLILFSLTIVAVILTLLFGGDFFTAFGTVVGGLFGYVLLGYVGLIVGATIGFLLNIWAPIKKAGKEEKERAQLYKKWSEEKRRRIQEQKNKRGKI